MFLSPVSLRQVARCCFTVIALGALTLLNPAFAFERNFEEGKHYQVVERRSTVEANTENTSVASVAEPLEPESSANEISVVEYFSYGCAHCYRLEFFIEGWLDSKADDVVFSRVATPSRDDWVAYARAYYIAEVLGITEKVHSLLFRAIYVNKQDMGREALLKRMFVNVAEVDPEKFDEVLESQKIPELVQNAVLEMVDFGVTATPTVVVDEQYLITPETAGDLGLMFEVVDFLIDKIKAVRDTEETAELEEAAS